MWFPLVLLAWMASCSACPDLCECHRNNIEKDALALIDITCHGRVPGLSEIPAEVRKLSVESVQRTDIDVLLNKLENTDLVNSFEMIDTLDDLDTNDTMLLEKAVRTNVIEYLPRLIEFAVTNCSLVSLNISWHGLERLRALNLSCNNLLRINDVSVIQTMNMSELMCFDLSDNLLVDVSVDAFRTLDGLVRLSLRKNTIKIVDKGAFQGLDQLEFLDLSDNTLANLPDSALTPLYSLQKLDLSGNHLQVLGARWFESLDRLRELDVSRNGLAGAASGTLQPLPGLSILKLAGNPLKEKDVSLLLGTGRRLETVDASHTGLARVPAALTRSVRALRLAGNRLTTIRSGDLDSYPLLRILNIADNRLTEIENDALGRLEVLEELDLSGNVLPKIPGSLPSSLTLLKLQRNEITALRLNDLNGLYNLRTLILNDNNIREIELGALGQLLLLTELDLSDNPIKALPTNTLSGPSNLAKLRMSGLTSLRRHQEEQSDMAFPVPTPERLIMLDVSRSPVLAEQLLADDATLSACKSLTELNLAETNISNVRSDLVYMLPQLRVLGLGKNNWSCTENLYWLGEWIRQHEELHQEIPAQCASPQQVSGLLLSELPSSSLSNSVSTIAGIIVTDSSMTIPVVSVLEHTSHINQPNVTMSSTSDSTITNYDHNITDLSTVSALDTQIERKIETIADLNGLTAETITTTVTPAKIPRVYEAPTSFRNVTSSMMARMNREPDGKEGTTNRILTVQNLIKYSINIPTSRSKSNDSEPSIRRTESETRPSTFDNRINNRTQKSGRMSKLATSPSEIISSEFSLFAYKRMNEERKTTEKSPRRINYAAKENAVLNDHDSNTITEKLNNRVTDSGARVSEALSAGAHPGMLLLAGAALSAVAALTVVLSRRATVHRTDRYYRPENIEVHTLMPTTELW